VFATRYTSVTFWAIRTIIAYSGSGGNELAQGKVVVECAVRLVDERGEFSGTAPPRLHALAGMVSGRYDPEYLAGQR